MCPNTKQNCAAVSKRELKCGFPVIPSDLLDDIINGSLELTYSLVAASVPGLDNLHLMSQFVFEFVDDPVITPFNETLSYQVGFNTPIMITVSGWNSWQSILKGSYSIPFKANGFVLKQ